MSKLERDLQKACIAKASSLGVLAINIHGSGWNNKGLPDLLCFHGGRAVAVELKSPDTGYSPQPDQMIWRRRFLAHDIPHAFVDDLTSFQQFIEKELLHV